MTLEQRKMFVDGRAMLWELNTMLREQGKPWGGMPTVEDMASLANRLDLTVEYVRARIETFLFN